MVPRAKHPLQLNPCEPACDTGVMEGSTERFLKELLPQV